MIDLRMKRILKTMMIAASAVLALLVLPLLLLQSKLIYHPRGYDQERLRTVDAEPLSYTTAQGRQVAWLAPRAATDAERVWLVFCGNGTVALDYAGYFDDPALKRDLFVLFDYPSYGQSEGSPSPSSIRESIAALLPAVAGKLGMPPEVLRPKLRVWGQSLGCAAALIAMEELGINQGILIAPFTSMMDMSRRTVGWPLCEVLRHRFDNVAVLMRLQARGGVQVTAFHGTDDEVIPFAMGEELGGRFPGMVRFEALPHGHHNDIIMTEKQRLLAAMAAMR